MHRHTPTHLSAGAGPGRFDCRMLIRDHPVDMTMIPKCPSPTKAASTKPPYCACPNDTESRCWKCCMPGVVETRILRRPVDCVKPACNYSIPAIPCWDPPKNPRLKCDPLCFDWTVDEPGPNDSYGLHGLNWWDWQMEGKYREKLLFKAKKSGYKPVHPGFSINQAEPDTPIYVCTRPIECYASSETPCKKSPFQTDVNYLRDWRCCSEKPASAWKPPYKQWATRVDL